MSTRLISGKQLTLIRFGCAQGAGGFSFAVKGAYPALISLANSIGATYDTTLHTGGHRFKFCTAHHEIVELPDC